MKKGIIFFVIAALLFIGSVSLFGQGNIGAGIFGLFLAAGLAAIGVAQLKKKAPAESSTAIAQQPVKRNAYIYTKAAGVTFDNEDGQSRQAILKALMEEYKAEGDEYGEDSEDDEAGDCSIPVSLVKTEYKGAPAIAIESELGQIGMIPKSDVEKVLAVFDRVIYANADLESFTDKATGENVFHADITVCYRIDV